MRWTREDALAYAAAVSLRMSRRHARSGGGRNAWPLAAALALVVAAVAGIDALGWVAPGTLPVLGMVALGSVALGVLAQAVEARRLSARAQALSFDANPHAYGPQEAVLDGWGATLSGRDGAGHRHPWTAIRAATRERGLVLLWLDPDKALAIPERGLRPGEADAALAAARDRLRGVPILE